ncbi:hypothetical protein ACGFX2_31965 [Streptomyces goshikiensis]|uniref:hypothetical protein n=1 Tax=Streptomyces goshikiensis TaxID=1942 RepID=UPI00371572C6
MREREEQGEDMEHTEGQDPRKETGSEGADDGPKHAIEAAYHGAGTGSAPAPAAFG